VTVVALYHFTTVNALRAIFEHGLTVGRTFSDKQREDALCVWLTSEADGTLLRGDARGGGAYLVRLTVEVDDVVSYVDWSRKIGWGDFIASFLPIPISVTSKWFLCFDWIKPSQIRAVKIGDQDEQIIPEGVNPSCPNVPIKWASGVPWRKRGKWLQQQLRAERAGEPGVATRRPGKGTATQRHL
jgi:hypothetical protein